MKALVQTGHGADSLQLREIEKPVVGDDRVLVRVRAASVNALDWHMLKPMGSRMAKLLGMASVVRGADLAGHVDTVGKSVTRFKPGDEVFGVGVGAFAEYAVARENRLALKPARLTFEQAAAMPVAGCTALEGLRAAKVQPGQRVLVYGAGGGVGVFAVQIAKALGAHVTAVTRTSHVDLMRSLGADEIIDYTREDFIARGQRYDVLFDVGADRSLAECRRAMTPNGKRVLAGAPEKMGELLVRLLEGLISNVGRERTAFFMAKVRPEELLALKDLVDAGKLTPPIDRQYPLSQAADAIRYVGTRGARGKVVITID